MQTYNDVYYHLTTEISQIFLLSASQAWVTIGTMNLPVLLNTSEINTVFRRVLGLHAEAITTLEIKFGY